MLTFLVIMVRQPRAVLSPIAFGMSASFGILTSCKTSSDVTEQRSDHLRRCSGAEKPSLSVGTRNPTISPSSFAHTMAMWAMLPLYALGIVPGAVAVAVLTKEYLVGLTDRRVVVLRVKGGKADVQEVTEYTVGERLPVTTTNGSLFAWVTVDDAARPFKAKFHRAGYPNNRENALAAAAALGAPARA